MRNLFICHRPYHILRCCDIISRDFKEGCDNILFTYDVKLEKKASFQRFDTNDIYSSYFDEIINMPRYDLPSVRDFFQLYRFCKDRRKEYLPYVEKYNEVDNIYFFADNELEVELLVGAFKERVNPAPLCILVDEGLVTYSALDHSPSWKRRVWLRIFTIIARLKYFNLEQTYGFSNIYNMSLANAPEKAIFFHKPIKTLPPLSEETCNSIRKKLKSKNVPKYNSPYFIYVGTYEKSFQDDMPVIRQLQSILNENGVNFYIKLHPQQKEELYKKEFGDGVILEKGVPIELFFGHNCLLGGTISSSLFNASLQGYFAMDLSRLFPEEKRKTWVQKPIKEQFDWIQVHEVNSYDVFNTLVGAFVTSLK